MRKGNVVACSHSKALLTTIHLYLGKCRRDLFILTNEIQSAHTFCALLENVFFSFCFLRRRIEFFIFFIIATGMEVIFCLLSIRKIEFRAVPTKTLPLNPSRKSLVSSKKPYCVFSLSRLTLLKHTYTLLPQIPKANLFRFSSLLGRFQSFAEFFLQLVGPNLKKQSIPHALFSLIVPCVSILVCLAIF